MNQLIKIEPRELAGATVQTCNARDLWQFVESRQEFANWIKGRIEKYGFAEGEDYTVDRFINGRATTIDYHLTIEMAKELAMVENNEKGRQVRRYFIECERRAKAAPVSDPMAVLSDPAAMRGLLLNYTEKVIALEEKVAEQAPKVAFAKQVEVAPDAIDIAKAAKLLGTGRTRLMAFLREIHWINRYNQPYQDKIEAGLLDTKLGKWEHPDHGLQQSVTTLVTGKGLVKLQKLWDERQQTIKAAGMMSVASRDYGSIGSQPESQHV